MSTLVLRLTITGRVQGVGYRAWLRDRARDADITGWVRNNSDGAVEALLAGQAHAVHALVEQCRTGPRGASVVGIASFASTEAVPTGFHILDDL